MKDSLEISKAVHPSSFRFAWVAFCAMTLLGCGGTGGGTISGDNQGTGVAVLSWGKPTINEDGSTITGLAGYQIFYGETSPVTEANSQSTVVLDPDQISHTLSGLNPGTYYFAVTAFNLDGYESGMSNEVSKTVL